MIYKKRIFSLFLLLAYCGLVGGCHKGVGSGIPIIGLNENGNLRIFNVSKTFGMRKFGKVMNHMSQEVIEQLDHRSPPGPWKVSKLIVGLNISSGFDVGVVGMNLGTLIELRFSRI